MMKSDPKPAFVLRGSSDPVSALNFIEFSDKDKINYLASGTQKGEVMIWNLKVRFNFVKWQAHESSVLWLRYQNDENFWTQGRMNMIKLWDINNGSPSVKFSIPVDNYLGFSGSDITSIEQYLICTPGPEQDIVSIWDAKTSVKICSLKPKNPKCGAVMQCKWVEDGYNLYVISAYESGIVMLWNWTECKVISEICLEDNPLAIEYSFMNKRFICGTVSNKVFILKLNESSVLSVDKLNLITNPGVSAVCSRPDGKVYSLAGWDHRVRLFSWKKLKSLAVLMYHKESIQCVHYSNKPVETFNNTGYLLAAGSCDRSISLWDLYN